MRTRYCIIALLLPFTFKAQTLAGFIGTGIYHDFVPDSVCHSNGYTGQYPTDFPLDINSDGTPDYLLKLIPYGGAIALQNWGSYLISYNNNKIAGDNVVCNKKLAHSFIVGDSVSSYSQWDSIIYLHYYYSYPMMSIYCNDAFAGGVYSGSGYIGLRMNIAGNPVFGWINLSFQKLSYDYYVTIDSWSIGPATVSIPEHGENNPVNVFPNPANETITVSTENDGKDVTLQVSDMYGKILKEVKTRSSSTEIGIQDLENGVYFLTLQGNANYFSKKIIVQH